MFTLARSARRAAHTLLCAFAVLLIAPVALAQDAPASTPVTQPDLTTLGWVGAAALVIGAIVRLLKSDSLATLLGQLGLPQIPPRVLPWLAIAFGLASSVLDVKVTGATWVVAITKGLVAGLSAIAGHELGVESLRAGKELFVIAIVVVIGASACTPAARWAVADLLAEKIECAIAHQDMTTEQIVAACAIEPSDVPKVLAIVEKSRQRSAERALDAATRQAEFDAKLHRMEERAGCGNDRDGGADVTAPSAP